MDCRAIGRPAAPRGPAGRRRPALPLAFMLVFALAACEGDTLYEVGPGTDPGDGGTVGPLASVEIQAVVPARVERTDLISALVTARGSGGAGRVRTVGLTVIVVDRESGETFVDRVEDQLEEPVSTTHVLQHAFVPPFPGEEAGAEALPAALDVELYGYAVTVDGRCTAAVPGLNGTFPCATRTVEEQQVLVAADNTAPSPTLVVMGRSAFLPDGLIADAVADVARGRLYLSNQPRNRVEVMNLNTFQFDNPVSVGAQPWGLGLNMGGDTLIVANSGGTSLSYVPLAGQLREAVDQRLRTPNLVLFEILISEDEQGFRRLHARFLDFSDRPQFLAQDAAGRVLFSTAPTGAAPRGTIRVATKQPGWQAAEARLLLVGDLAVRDGADAISIAHVDSLRVFRPADGSNDLIEIYDHRSGFPNQVIRTGIVTLEEALESMAAHPDSDIYWTGGLWDTNRLGLSDTTFVAASADRRWVAFGEGSAEHGRVVLWDALRADISNEITTRDLVGNTAERLLGVDLNADGSLGVARGTLGAYYFTPDLRLQGSGPVAANSDGGAGAVLLPAHPSYGSLTQTGSSTLSFVATPNRTIRVYDTVHFTERGEIPLRDNVVGPLRVSTPLASELQGCGDACPIAKLYGVTDSGAVVVVDVLPQHIRPAF